MPNELPDPSAPPADETTHQHGLENGFQLVLEAEDRNDWKPVALWLACNPALAGDVAQFLDDQEKMRVAMPPPSVAPDRAGTSFGGLEIREVVGRGGMGIVYRAYDPRLNKDVAVKMLRANGSPADLARFRFEAEMVASLDHPNIVPVYSFGEADGAPYLVMPLMTGGSLAERLRNLGPDRCLPEKEAAELVREIARGVHHAHQRGLIHRDLKPGNILLDRDGVPHVADFGLARWLDASASGSGSIAGTIPYMAPEQARGEKGLTTAVDVHALGAILFELLTGRTPFGGGDIASVLRRVLEEPAPAVRTLRPVVDCDLETICRRCLEKHAEDRYLSAQELVDDLTRFLNGEWIPIREPTLAAGLGRAFRHKPERLIVTSWPGFLMGAVFTFATQGLCQLAALTGSDGRVVFGLLSVNLLGWWFLYWHNLIHRARWKAYLSSVSGVYVLGALLGATALLSAHVADDATHVLRVYQPLTVVFGLGAFVHGAVVWGRMYLAGLILLGIAGLMPLVPVQFWPGIHALAFGGFALWFGASLRVFEREAHSPTP